MIGRCVGYASSPSNGGEAVATNIPTRPMKNRPATNMAMFSADPCNIAAPIIMIEPMKMGIRRPNLSATKGAIGRATTPPMVCIFTMRPSMPPEGWSKSVKEL
jgi:hypothetical protein